MKCSLIWIDFTAASDFPHERSLSSPMKASHSRFQLSSLAGDNSSVISRTMSEYGSYPQLVRRPLTNARFELDRRFVLYIADSRSKYNATVNYIAIHWVGWNSQFQITCTDPLCRHYLLPRKLPEYTLNQAKLGTNDLLINIQGLSGKYPALCCPSSEN